MPFTPNLKPATNSALLRALGSLVITAGGSVIDHSNGTAVVAGAPATDTTLNGPDRWIRIRLPNVTHQFCFQLYAAAGEFGSYNLRITFSRSGFNNDGTVNITPTASDQKTILGGGTNASPAYTAGLPTENTYVAQMYVSNTLSAPGFWVKTYPIGGGELDFSWMMDPLIAQIGVADADPYVYWISNDTHRANSQYEQPNAGPWCFFKAGLAGEQFVRVAACFLRNTASRLAGTTNPQTGKLDSYSVVYGSTTGIKGISKLHEFNYRVALTNALAANVEGAPLSKVLFGDIVCNWDGVSTPDIL